MKAMRNMALKALAVLFGLMAFTSGLAQLSDVFAGRASVLALIPSVLFAGLAWLCWRYARAGAGRQGGGALDRMAQEATEYFQAVITAREFPAPRPDRLLDDAGEPLLAVCNARLLELRRQTSRVGVGTRINVAGMPFYVGRSDPITRTELQEMSQGELGITSRRLLFSGPLRSADFDLARVAAVDVMADAISLSVTGRQNPVYLQVSNPLLWGQLVRSVKQMRLDGRRLADGQQVVLG